uniref:Capsid assembly protein n=1 Tax=viral metagenome TaxID=1070528 RepID=A0A6M3K7S4_9ZZZZ
MTDQVTAGTQNQDQIGSPGASPESLGWRAGLPDPLKTDETFKQYKTVGDFAKAHVETAKKATELEGRMANAIFKPGENATPEEKAAFHKALGVPDKPADYEFPKGEGVEHDEKMLTWARDIFHKAGLNKDQAGQISQAWDELSKNIVSDLKGAEDTALKEVETKLKEEWKADYDKNFELSTRAFKKFAGAELSEFKAHPTLVKAFYEVGKAMGEDFSPAGLHSGVSPPQVGMKYDMPTFA